MTYDVIIKSDAKQSLSSKMMRKIRAEFRREFGVWKDEGQKNINGLYRLTVCEKIEIGTDEDFISIPIEFSKDEYVFEDGGYLHVYGLKEVEN